VRAPTTWRLSAPALLGRGLAAALGLALAPACSSPEPVDPCPGLRAAYEAARAGGGCASDAECVGAPGLEAPVDPGGGSMGEPPPPCGSAAPVSALPEVERAAEAFRAAGCGRVGPPGSTRCVHFTHGAHPSCLEGRCELVL
jgi:hypothetical protein